MTKRCRFFVKNGNLWVVFRMNSAPEKKKFKFFVVVPQRDRMKNPLWGEKKFVSLENGCIFALAFDGKTVWLKRREKATVH